MRIGNFACLLLQRFESQQRVVRPSSVWPPHSGFQVLRVSV